MSSKSGAVHPDSEARIVVGVDGSPYATRALEHAAHEAARTNALLVVVCVYGMPPSGTTLALPIGLLEEDAEEVLRQALAHVSEITPEVVTKGEVVLGTPGRVLVELSAGSSGVVVGTRGHGHVAGMILGSVSDYVVHHASCTTTVVR
jgi:nucleotide-binding universal stress UspA family protein